MVRPIEQHTFGGGQHVRRGAGHGPAEHAYCVGDVGRVCVEQLVECRRGIGTWSEARRLRGVVCDALSFGEEGRLDQASTQSASVVMSTLSRSNTGPSSSTFHRAERSVVKEE
eukprot:4512881-Pleurochrysis_carterae.AAC.1